MRQKCKKSVERGWIFIYLERQVACGVGDIVYDVLVYEVRWVVIQGRDRTLIR